MFVPSIHQSHSKILLHLFKHAPIFFCYFIRSLKRKSIKHSKVSFVVTLFFLVSFIIYCELFIVPISLICVESSSFWIFLGHHMRNFIWFLVSKIGGCCHLVPCQQRRGLLLSFGQPSTP